MAKPAPSLLDHAVLAVQSIHAVQIGLAHAGADPHAIQQVGECAQVMTQVVKALGNGPALDQASGGAQPAGPPQGQPAGPPPGQPTGPPPGPPQAAAPAGPPSGGSGGMLAAAKVLQAAHAAANAK